jgi:probable HAF family extracellular repeat protein
LSPEGPFPLFTGMPLSGTGRPPRSASWRRHDGATAGGGRASGKNTKPKCRKCFRRNRQLSERALRLNCMARRRMRNSITDLRTFGGAVSSPAAINRAGQVVGGAGTASGAYHAFLYSGGGKKGAG